MADRLVITSDTLTPGMKAFPENVNIALTRTVDFFSPRVESYARANAPWTDRTGNARSGLHAQPFHEADQRHGIIIAHSVPYGIWLEVRFEGKYAIIIPTIKVQGKELMNSLRGFFKRVPGG